MCTHACLSQFHFVLIITKFTLFSFFGHLSIYLQGHSSTFFISYVKKYLIVWEHKKLFKKTYFFRGFSKHFIKFFSYLFFLFFSYKVNKFSFSYVIFCKLAIKMGVIPGYDIASRCCKRIGVIKIRPRYYGV